MHGMNRVKKVMEGVGTVRRVGDRLAVRQVGKCPYFCVQPRLSVSATLSIWQGHLIRLADIVLENVDTGRGNAFDTVASKLKGF